MSDSVQPSPSPIQAFPYGFAAIFIGLFLLFELLYFLVPVQHLNFTLYPLFITEPSAAIINWLGSEIPVNANNQYLQSRTANLQIVRGCDGSGVLFLLMSAVLAFRTSIKNKLIGLVAGMVFVYVVNLVRIIFIYYIVSHYKHLFVEFHSLIAPTIIIILTSFAFLLWANWANAQQTAS